MLDAANLDLLLVTELLEKEGLNWSSEFETMGTQTLEDSELSNVLLKTAKKVSRKTLEESIDDVMASPGTIGVSAKLEDSFVRLGGVQGIIKTMAKVEFDADGQKITETDPRFEEGSYTKFCKDVYDRIDILSEHADCISDCLRVIPVLQKKISEPLHDMGNGLKLEVASLRGNLGPKDLTRLNVPPGLWNETGFD